MIPVGGRGMLRIAAACLCGCVLLGASGCPEQARGTTERLPEWTLEPEWQVGQEDGGPAFSSVTAIETAGDSLVFVADRRDAAIHVLDLHGRSRGRWGRSGAGPGEFRNLVALAYHGDTLFAIDPTMARVTAFDAAGRVVGTTAADSDLPSDGFAPPRPLGRFRDGSVLAAGAVLPPAVGGAMDSVPLVRVPAEGRSRLIGRLSHRGLGAEVPVGGTVSASILHPIRSDDLAAVTADGRAVLVVRRAPATEGESGRFTVTRLDPGGDTLFTRGYPYAPVPVARPVVDSVVQSVLRSVGRMGASAAPSAVERALALPRYEPPVSGLVAGRDGSIWLRREALGRAQATWMVLDSAGTPRARVLVPASVRLLAADSNTAHGVMPGEDDVPVVVRYRLRKSGGRGP